MGRGVPGSHSGGAGGPAGPLPAVAAQRQRPGPRLGAGSGSPGSGTELPAAALCVSMAAWREPARAIRHPEERLLKIARAAPGSLAAGLLAARYPLPALLPARVQA